MKLKTTTTLTKGLKKLEIKRIWIKLETNNIEQIETEG
jgi:hypothetical protein